MNKNLFPGRLPQLAALLLMLLLMMIGACATLPSRSTAPTAPTPSTPTTGLPTPVAGTITGVTTAVAVTDTTAAAAEAVADINRDGRVIQLGRFVEDAPIVQPPDNDVVELNYEQEDLRVVIEQLGAVLNLNMIIDPTINTRVSLRSSPNNPLRYGDIWPLLRQLARNAGITIEQAGNVFEFTVNASNIPAEIVLPDTLNTATSSEVLQVTPLTYISIEAAEAIINPLLQPGGSVTRLGPANLLGIYASPQQLERINALLAVLDDDPFLNQGIQLYPLVNSQATAVAEELQGILTLIEGEQSSYQVLGLERINAVLVVAPAARGFEEVTRWVRVLDGESQEQGEQLFVYRVKNLTATTLAETLINVFGDGEEAEAAQNAGQGPLITPDGNQQNTVVGPFGGFSLTTGAADEESLVSANLSVTIVADEDTNSLLVLASPREYRQLLTTISQLDTVPLQVLINAVIGQVTLTDGMQFGIDWTRVSANVASGPARLTSRFLPGGLFDEVTGLPVQGPGSGLMLTRTFMDGSAVIDATLSAIAQDNEVRLLARPTLLATNNQEGEIKVGQLVPVNQGVSQIVGGGQTQNIGYEDVGIELRITPRINDDGFVNLTIFQKLSSIQASGTGGVAGNPTFTNQEITTTVVVSDQATITLGGLIQDDSSGQNSGVPYLQKIPVLGALFSYQQLQSERRELFIILRPQIIRGDGSDNAQLQEFRASFTNVSNLLREAGL